MGAAQARTRRVGRASAVPFVTFSSSAGRSLLQIPGAISLNGRRIAAIALNQHDPYARSITSGLQPGITTTQLLFYLGKT